MNFSDLLIIYLACGAPFAVYYFLLNRKHFDTKKLWLKSAITFIFWVPFAINLLIRNKVFSNFPLNLLNQPTLENHFNEERLDKTRKELEKILRKSGLNVSIYEFREIFDRYAGLTIASKTPPVKKVKEKDLFKVSSHTNAELASICLNRRNRKHLSFHQTNARQDFLSFTNDLLIYVEDKVILHKLTKELAKFLKDETAHKRLDEIFGSLLQNGEDLFVKISEEEKWKTEQQKQSPANQIPIGL